MNLYLDTSALVKRYIVETGSPDVNQWIEGAPVVATSLITRAETSSAITRAIRVGILPQDLAQNALFDFRAEWPNFLRLSLTEHTISKADELAWSYGLRGYDAVHLASAISWQEMLREPITMMTFDQQLSIASTKLGLNILPEQINQ
jgi:uncharacterized protein